MSAEALQRLRRGAWLERARPFLDCLEGRAGRTRVVGGLVRDTLLGIERSATDLDMATELLPDTVMERAHLAGFAAHPTGIEHGTVTLVARGVTAEVTTLREDVETFGRHAQVRFGTDWAADAARRDFTMNALYAGPDGELFDPLGGLDDCLARRVRFIGNADSRIAEDRLRVYRYFRFAASHGGQQFDPEALAACARAANTLGNLSAERVGAEMTRLLALPAIAETLAKMIEAAILRADVLPAPALPLFASYEQQAAHPDAVARLALFGLLGVSLSQLQARWRLSNTLRKSADALCAAADMARRGQWNLLAYRHQAIKVEACELAAVLDGWDAARLLETREKLAALDPGPFPLKGADLKANGYANGPALGAELERLQALWIDSGFVLNRQALLEKVRLPG